MTPTATRPAIIGGSLRLLWSEGAYHGRRDAWVVRYRPLEGNLLVLERNDGLYLRVPGIDGARLEAAAHHLMGVLDLADERTPARWIVELAGVRRDLELGEDGDSPPLGEVWATSRDEALALARARFVAGPIEVREVEDR